MKDLFIAEIFLNLPLHGLDIGQDVSVRDHDSAGLSGSAGGKDNLQCVLTREPRRWVRGGVALGNHPRERLERDGRSIPAYLVPARMENERGVHFLRHAAREF